MELPVDCTIDPLTRLRNLVRKPFNPIAQQGLDNESTVHGRGADAVDKLKGYPLSASLADNAYCGGAGGDLKACLTGSGLSAEFRSCFLGLDSPQPQAQAHAAEIRSSTNTACHWPKFKNASPCATASSTMSEDRPREYWSERVPTHADCVARSPRGAGFYSTRSSNHGAYGEPFYGSSWMPGVLRRLQDQLALSLPHIRLIQEVLVKSGVPLNRPIRQSHVDGGRLRQALRQPLLLKCFVGRVLLSSSTAWPDFVQICYPEQLLSPHMRSPACRSSSKFEVIKHMEISPNSLDLEKTDSDAVIHEGTAINADSKPSCKEHGAENSPDIGPPNGCCIESDQTIIFDSPPATTHDKPSAGYDDDDRTSWRDFKVEMVELTPGTATDIDKITAGSPKKRRQYRLRNNSSSNNELIDINHGNRSKSGSLSPIAKKSRRNDDFSENMPKTNHGARKSGGTSSSSTCVCESSGIRSPKTHLDSMSPKQQKLLHFDASILQIGSKVSSRPISSSFKLTTGKTGRGLPFMEPLPLEDLLIRQMSNSQVFVDEEKIRWTLSGKEFRSDEGIRIGRKVKVKIVTGEGGDKQRFVHIGIDFCSGFVQCLKEIVRYSDNLCDAVELYGMELASQLLHCDPSYEEIACALWSVAAQRRLKGYCPLRQSKTHTRFMDRLRENPMRLFAYLFKLMSKGGCEALNLQQLFSPNIDVARRQYRVLSNSSVTPKAQRINVISDHPAVSNGIPRESDCVTCVPSYSDSIPQGSHPIRVCQKQLPPLPVPKRVAKLLESYSHSHEDQNSQVVTFALQQIENRKETFLKIKNLLEGAFSDPSTSGIVGLEFEMSDGRVMCMNLVVTVDVDQGVDYASSTTHRFPNFNLGARSVAGQIQRAIETVDAPGIVSILGSNACKAASQAFNCPASAEWIVKSLQEECVNSGAEGMLESLVAFRWAKCVEREDLLLAVRSDPGFLFLLALSRLDDDVTQDVIQEHWGRMTANHN